MEPRRVEPVVRIRCAGPEDEARCRRALDAAGLAPQQSLSWLVVRDAHPDDVNEVVIAAGARGRVVVRERIGQLVGWLLDREGNLAGRERNVRSLVERILADGGLATRYAPRDDAALLAAAAALYARLVAEAAPFVSWDAFVDAFCVGR
jgi:hypothetical protein